VVVQIEFGILDPERMVELEGDLHQSAPERRQQRKPVLHQGADPLE